MNGQSLKHLVASSGLPEVHARLMEGLELYRDNPRDPNALRPEMFSIRELAEAYCGENWVERMNPKNLARAAIARHLYEAGDAVDVSGFSHITGQIIYNRILEGWNLPGMIMDEVFETVQTEFDGERMPWITDPLALGEEVHPGMAYPEFGLTEEYIDTPALHTFGGILSVHKLAIFYDRTGQLLRKAGKMGERLKWKMEFQKEDTLLGVAGTSQFTWKGVTYNPYQVNGTYWSNDIYSNPLIDWTSFRRVEIAATKVLEPDLRDNAINQPIDIDLDTVIAMPARQWDLDRTLHATQLRSVRLDAAPNQVTIGGNVVKAYKPIIGKQLWRRAVDGLGLSPTVGTGSQADMSQADDLWFMANSKAKPLAWMQAWPLLSVPSPANAPWEFERDIVFRQKSGWRGVAAWLDPRQVWRIHGTAA